MHGPYNIFNTILNFYKCVPAFTNKDFPPTDPVLGLRAPVLINMHDGYA